MSNSRKYNISVGDKFGRLTVVEDLGRCKKPNSTSKKIARYVRCSCDCGNEYITDIYTLIHGTCVSCGCYNKEAHKDIGERSKKFNDYKTFGCITFVKFSNCDEYFLCDTNDWEKLNKYCWRKNEYGYAVTNSKIKGENRFHRIITNCPKSLEVDHQYRISQGVLDNRKENLIVCSHKENMKNVGIRSNNTSGYSGVSFNKRTQKYEVYINVDGERIFLGYFKNIKDAISARKEAEVKYWNKVVVQ